MSKSPTHSAKRITLWLPSLALMVVIITSVLFIAKAQTVTVSPVLLSQATSTRAIALNATTFTAEPFSPTTLDLLSQPTRTRILLFAMNMALPPGSDFSNVAANAQDASGRRYPLTVEHVGPVVVGQHYVSQITLRLNDDLGDVGDVLVQVTYNGVASNRVRVGIGHIGGGPPDDSGAIPTPGPYAPTRHSISGRITKNSGEGLGGATVTLSGFTSSSIVTDATGVYSFTNLTESGNYTVTATRANYTVSPISHSFNNLRADVTGNFVATPLSYTISGQVTDHGVGLSDVTVTLSGSQSATRKTDTNGNYTFTVAADGNYVVTPEKSFCFCTFSPPSQAFNNLSGNQVVNFATLDPFYVLEFDGSTQTVEFKNFWQGPDVNLPPFFWEVWAMPGEAAGGRYMLSDGYGGAHAVLFGMGYPNDTSGRYTLYGNTWNGTAVTTFGGDDGPAPYEWGHMAVGWDGTHVTTYYNGVPVGSTPFLGPRRSFTNSGGGDLYIGGSDHQNFIGRISQVRAHEGSNPRAEYGGNGAPRASFQPQTVFSTGADFLVNFFRPSQTSLDLSGGRVGTIRGVGFGARDPRHTYPAPQFVIDPTAPTTRTDIPPVPPSVLVDSPPPVPANARVFDSFSRRNVTRAFDGNEGLGSTEGGSAGKQTWEYYQNPQLAPAFGILNGRAVVLNNESCAAVVSTGAGSANLDIRVNRTPRDWGSGTSTGLIFRAKDANNHFFAYAEGESVSTQRLTVVFIKDGAYTTLASSIAMPVTWFTLRVITLESGSIEVYADLVLLYSGNNPNLALEKKAGLLNWGLGRALHNRWDNFVVMDAQ